MFLQHAYYGFFIETPLLWVKHWPRRRRCDSLDQRPPVVPQAELQLLQDLAALRQLRGASIWKRHVVDGESSLLVDVQQGGDTVMVQFCPGAENEHVLDALAVELLCVRTRKRVQMTISVFRGCVHQGNLTLLTTTDRVSQKGLRQMF